MNENTKSILSCLTYHAQESNGVDDLIERIAIAIDAIGIDADNLRYCLGRAIRSQAEMDHAESE